LSRCLSMKSGRAALASFAASKSCSSSRQRWSTSFAPGVASRRRISSWCVFSTALDTARENLAVCCSISFFKAAPCSTASSAGGGVASKGFMTASCPLVVMVVAVSSATLVRVLLEVVESLTVCARPCRGSSSGCHHQLSLPQGGASIPGHGQTLRTFVRRRHGGGGRLTGF